MSFTPTQYRTPEEMLGDMIAGLQFWRAMVAKPLADYDTVAFDAEAGSVPLGDAANRVLQCWVEGNEDDPTPRPRCYIRQFEPENITRDGAYWLDGTIGIAFELSVPESHYGAENLAILDARKKLWAMRMELLLIGKQAGGLNIESLAFEPCGIVEPTRTGFGPEDLILVGMWSVGYSGSACG